MLKITTIRNTVTLVLAVGNTTRKYPLDWTDKERFEALLMEVHALHEELTAKEQTTLVDLLFKDGVPQYIHLKRPETRGKSWTFQLQLYKDPVSETVYMRPVTASASVSQYGLESAFEVVWSKLELALGISELPNVLALKFVMLGHFRKQYLYRIK